jgi:uncharacterized protein YfbU (UPF0304 family)
MEDLREKTEKELMDVKVGFPKTIEEVNEIINQLTDREHDYGTAVYAMSIAATAVFNFVASKVGCSGYQSSIADMDIIRRTRSLELGFMLIDFEKLLYPQYDGSDHFPTKQALIEKHRKMLAKKARELLAKETDAHPNVLAHWKMLAAALD